MLLTEALDAGVAIRVVYVEVDPRDSVEHAVRAARDAGVRVQHVVDGALAKVLDLGTPQSVVAVAEQPSHAAPQLLHAAAAGARPVLALVDVADPGNVGTLVRTAEAAGCGGVVLVGSCADLFNPKTVRATAGSVFRVPVAPVGDLAEVQRQAAVNGMRLVGTVGGGGAAPEQTHLDGAVVIVVGSEAHGLSATSLAMCDSLVSIPMEGRTESLNAAVAGSVVAFDAARQRRSAVSAQAIGERSGDRTSSVGHNDDPFATGRAPSGPPAPEHGSPPR